MARTKPSTKPKTLSQKYSTEVAKIRRRIKAAEQRGFMFDERIERILQKPKQVKQASLRKLKRLSREGLYKYARYGGELTGGEIVSGTKGRELERKAAAAKGAQTRKENRERVNRERNFFADSVINNYKEMLNTYSDKIRTAMLNWINGLISEHGKQAVAEMLNDGAEAGNIFTPEIAYTEEKRNQYMSEMLDYLPGGEDKDRRTEISDALELDEEGFIIADYSGIFGI